MTERANGADNQMLAIWSKSFINRYDRWRRKDLFTIAVETMPKQVKTKNLINNLTKLKADFAKRLDSES